MEHQKREDLPEKIEITFEIGKGHVLKYFNSNYENLTMGEILDFKLKKEEVTFKENKIYQLFEENNFLEEKTGKYLIKLLYSVKE